MAFQSKFQVQKGFSLVELMVALVIGLIILLGAGQIFLMSLQSFRQVQDIAERQDDLRFFSSMLSLDIRSSSRVVGGNDVLELEYFSGAREKDLYCGAGEDLIRVLYGFEEVGGIVYLQYGCSDFPLDLSAKQPLFLNVVSASFNVFDSYVDVSVAFEPLRGEPQGGVFYNFKVARRNAVISRL